MNSCQLYFEFTENKKQYFSYFRKCNNILNCDPRQNMSADFGLEPEQYEKKEEQLYTNTLKDCPWKLKKKYTFKSLSRTCFS